MTRLSFPVVGLAVFVQMACLDQTAVLERELERTFSVDAGSTVRVELSGGSVTALTGPPGVVRVSVRQAVYSNDREAAEEVLADYRVTATQEGDEVSVVGRRKNLLSGLRWGRVRLSATITAPPDVVLELGTSGGRVTIRGDRVAEARATTSGGSLSADGGRGDLVLSTSGGSIKVGRVLGRLDADTSGGSITIGYVGPSARDVDLSTSGGSIRVGIDPAGAFALSAGTTGGSVRIDDLPFEPHSAGRTHANGTLNGGGAALRATTSGGGIRLASAADPGAVSVTSPIARVVRQ
jgi:hypothetical protein